jgi:hypothetical protein
MLPCRHLRSEYCLPISWERHGKICVARILGLQTGCVMPKTGIDRIARGMVPIKIDGLTEYSFENFVPPPKPTEESSPQQPENFQDDSVSSGEEDVEPILPRTPAQLSKRKHRQKSQKLFLVKNMLKMMTR